MLDVGQGDAILLRDGDRALLLDGGGLRGGDIGGRALLPALLGEGVDHLDALVMSHPDHDHCGGLVDIAAYLPVREVWMAPGWDPAGCAGSLLALPGVRTRFLWRGKGHHLRALAPPRAASRRRTTSTRSTSARSSSSPRCAAGVRCSPATSRAGPSTTSPAAARGAQADLLKVAHHGSRTSSTPAFLAAVAPRLALISVGLDNRYHHPSPEVVARLSARSRCCAPIARARSRSGSSRTAGCVSSCRPRPK